jgi:SAM-dependent methyltransferase
MSSTFHSYSLYYDLLYQDKDYNGEAEYIRKLIAQWAPKTQTILELGCGTGRHAELLCRMGYNIVGIEASESMLTKSQERVSAPDNPNQKGSFEVQLGDARKINLSREFHTVLSLFHVVSYQTSNEDLLALFRTASRHLVADGVFIFDVWYGPAVLTHRPEVRIKRIATKTHTITRLAEPRLDTSENTVDVHYNILIKSIDGEILPGIEETHKMRYLFTPEIKLIAELNGMEILHAEEWLSSKSPSTDSWGVLFIARKK